MGAVRARAEQLSEEVGGRERDTEKERVCMVYDLTGDYYATAVDDMDHR